MGTHDESPRTQGQCMRAGPIPADATSVNPRPPDLNIMKNMEILELRTSPRGGKILRLLDFRPPMTVGPSMAITPDTTLSRNGDILYASVGSEDAVMLNVTAGNYYGLNAVAARIWELLE